MAAGLTEHVQGMADQVVYGRAPPPLLADSRPFSGGGRVGFLPLDRQPCAWKLLGLSRHNAFRRTSRLLCRSAVLDSPNLLVLPAAAGTDAPNPPRRYLYCLRLRFARIERSMSGVRNPRVIKGHATHKSGYIKLTTHYCSAVTSPPATSHSATRR